MNKKEMFTLTAWQAPGSHDSVLYSIRAGSHRESHSTTVHRCLPWVWVGRGAKQRWARGGAGEEGGKGKNTGGEEGGKRDSLAPVGGKKGQKRAKKKDDSPQRLPAWSPTAVLTLPVGA
jgi:hypothetical protein